MSSGSIVPPDIREQMSRSGGARGIGGGAQENAVAAQARQAAMGNAPAPEESVEAEEAASQEVETTEPEKCPACRKDLERQWYFCANCGAGLMQNAASRLGIEFTDDDLQDYLFKGFITRELTLLGSVKILVKSSQPQDMDEVDNYLMNGKWGKDAAGKPRQVSDFYMRQINTLAAASTNILKLNGVSIGDTLEAKISYLMERGSELVDMLCARVVLYNKAVKEYLRAKDTLPGS